MMVIAGYGFVGKAYELFFKGRFADIKIVDPQYNTSTIDKDTQYLVVCVPTPQSTDGACDISIVYDVVKAAPDHAKILIKSTISLDGWNTLKEAFPQKEICFSPEFLRAANYLNDIKDVDNVILSGDYSFWADQYSIQYPDIKQYIVKPQEAILIKYFRNSFLATKVSFFNHVYDMCTASGIDFGQVRAGIAHDTRIGHSHTQVMPDDGVRGFGGMCFPKDTAALLKMAADKNINLNTLEAAVEYNKTLQKKT
jgi:UDPglucose 6-dehydrogenase|tara:strand:- start:2001 stop:2759 length:759 start_codon:yes stop_codon:yes gene_type:complete